METENIAFLVEDFGYFIKKLKTSSSTKIYIVDIKMNQIRKIDLFNFIKELIKYENIEIMGEKQIIFVENCEVNYQVEDFLIWKLNQTAEIKEEWLLLAIGLYKINYKKIHEIKKGLLSLAEKITVNHYYNPLGFAEESIEDKKNVIKKFFKKIEEIETQWNCYSTEAAEMAEIKKVKEILNKEKISYNDSIFKDFYNMKNKKNQFILKGNFYRNKENYIYYYKECFIHHLSEIIEKSNQNKTEIYSECFNDSKSKKISKILNHKAKLEFNDYPNLLKVINYLKMKNKSGEKFIEEYEEYYLDYLYFKCLNFEFFEAVKDYDIGEWYLKLNYSLKKNWIEKAFERFIVNGKEIYVERLEPDDSYCMDVDSYFLYIEGMEKQIKRYNPKEGKNLVGKIYEKEKIEKMKKTIMLVAKEMN